MQLRLYKALWGMEGPLADQFARIAAAGYTGIECGLPEPGQEQAFKDLLARYKFDLIAMVFTAGPDHLASYQRQVERAAAWKPRSITSHSGRDSMSLAQQMAFFEGALKVDRAAGILVGHETHRGRAFYNPWGTAQVLSALPELRVVADLSHWCCVAESLLQDCGPEVALACERAIHIHGRVGHEHGPQVSDPRAPEFAGHVAAHEQWWASIREAHARRGEASLSFTPEFGPPPYLPVMPYSQAPVADLWDICLWMAQRTKASFQGSRV